MQTQLVCDLGGVHGVGEILGGGGETGVTATAKKLQTATPQGSEEKIHSTES